MVQAMTDTSRLSPDPPVKRQSPSLAPVSPGLPELPPSSPSSSKQQPIRPNSPEQSLVRPSLTPEPAPAPKPKQTKKTKGKAKAKAAPTIAAPRRSSRPAATTATQKTSAMVAAEASSQNTGASQPDRATEPSSEPAARQIPPPTVPSEPAQNMHMAESSQVVPKHPTPPRGPYTCECSPMSDLTDGRLEEVAAETPI
jgi:hypothetical protein